MNSWMSKKGVQIKMNNFVISGNIEYISDRLHVAQILACIAQHTQQHAELVDASHNTHNNTLS